MCDIATALTIGSLALGAIGQQQQARATVSAQNAYNRQAEQNAIIARNANLANLEVERTTAAADAREQVNQNNLAARRAMATARTSAGEAGVAGLSVDALLRDLAGQAGYDNTTVEVNYLRQDRDINIRRENAQNQYVSGLNSIRQPQVSGANWLATGLRIAQVGYQGYTDARIRQERLRNPQQ